MNLKTALIVSTVLITIVRVAFGLFFIVAQYELDTQLYRYALTFTGLGVIVFAINRLIKISLFVKKTLL